MRTRRGSAHQARRGSLRPAAPPTRMTGRREYPGSEPPLAAGQRGRSACGNRHPDGDGRAHTRVPPPSHHTPPAPEAPRLPSATGSSYHRPKASRQSRRPCRAPAAHRLQLCPTPPPCRQAHGAAHAARRALPQDHPAATTRHNTTLRPPPRQDSPGRPGDGVRIRRTETGAPGLRQTSATGELKRIQAGDDGRTSDAPRDHDLIERHPEQLLAR